MRSPTSGSSNLDKDREVQIDLLRRLTVEHFMTHAEWPTLRVLQRRLVREFDATWETRELARELSPTTYVRFHDLNDLLVLDVEELAREPASSRLLGALVGLVGYASVAYKEADLGNDVYLLEARITENLNLAPSLMGPLRELSRQIPYLGSWLTTADKVVFHVSDDIMRYRDVTSVAVLLEVLSSIRRSESESLEQLTMFKHSLVTETDDVEGPIGTKGRLRHLIDLAELHPLVKITILVGSLATGLAVVIAVFIWVLQFVL